MELMAAIRPLLLTQNLKNHLGRKTAMDSTGSEGGGFVGLDFQNGAYGSDTFHFGYPDPK